MKRAVIIHGWNSVPDEGWRPWLAKELHDRGYEVHMPAMPNTAHPQQDEWVQCIKDLVGTPDEKTLLIGHSLGAAAMLRYLEQLPKEERVGAVIFVAGFSNSVGIAETENFVADHFQWDAIHSHCKTFVALHSDNDRYVSRSEGDTFRDKLGANVVVIPDGGHFGSGEGYTSLPILTDIIDHSIGL